MRLSLILLLSFSLAACGGGRDMNRIDSYNRAAAPASVTTRGSPARYPVFGDADPHPWEDRRPSHYPVHGIDVSRWQGDIDWFGVRDSGVGFAYIKATEGGDVADPMFDQNWADAANAGVPRGAYHYYYFCRSAAEQARWFIAHVPRDPRALPPVLDMEWNHQSRSCPYKPDGATVRAEAEKFLSILTRHYGTRPVVYTTVDFYRDTGIGTLRNTDFWLRSVAGHPSEVYPGGDWTFWQYTGTGIVSGVRGRVDINAFKGSPAQWAGWRVVRAARR